MQFNQINISSSVKLRFKAFVDKKWQSFSPWYDWTCDTNLLNSQFLSNISHSTKDLKGQIVLEEKALQAEDAQRFQLTLKFKWICKSYGLFVFDWEDVCGESWKVLWSAMSSRQFFLAQLSFHTFNPEMLKTKTLLQN